MEIKSEEKVQLLPADELGLRLGHVTAAMRQGGIDAMLLCDNANIFYLTGRVFCGYIYIDSDANIRYFVRRPSVLHGDGMRTVRKPEEIKALLSDEHLSFDTLALELDDVPCSVVLRLAAAIGVASPMNASAVMRRARSVKTDREISKIEASAVKLTEVYRRIPHLYQEGMSDIELQIEIERNLRLEGCLGQFRVTGHDLEIFMGNVLTGENADTPSPYDFAMGGAGMNPSLPVGADGTIIKPGRPVMVDMNGNFNGYMPDMTRCYIVDEIPPEVASAHSLSCDICAAVAQNACEGASASALYELAAGMAASAGMADYFMGHRYHAGFVGHGVGIAVNEQPVLAPRSKAVLQAGNVIAVEPKFVIPGFGAIGIENTYVVGSTGAARRLTDAPEVIASLD